MNIRDEEVFNDRICKLCSNYATCSRDKFIVMQNSDKLSMKCPEYIYTNSENLT